ncbi:aldo/keto reductase [Draconibacterium sp.]
MENTNQSKGINRRKFLQTGSAFAAATMFLPFGGNKIFGINIVNLATNPIPYVSLNIGVKMPRLGFGTNTLNGPTCVQCVSDAISVGYRLVDTAHVYGNEEFVGEGIKQSGVQREELFITSKLWVDFYGYDITKKAFETSLNKLGLEYLDLYLLHRPRGDVKGAWKALEDLYEKGKIKSIGVSNFDSKQLDELKDYAKIIPAINQIETHAFFQQHDSYKTLKEAGVQMEAWSPFAAGRNNIFSNQTLADIGKKYNKSIAQVCLRWHFQRGIVAIPRSSQKAHMIENLNIFDFELSATDLQTISKLDLNATQFPEWS